MSGGSSIVRCCPLARSQWTMVVLKAMKMETEVTAQGADTIARVLVEGGTAVQAQELLVEFAG